MIVNFAERAHNHNWELDPVTRSLLDTDFYKLLMLQFIWKHYPKTQVSFSLFNRTSSVRLADMFAVEELSPLRFFVQQVLMVGPSAEARERVARADAARAGDDGKYFFGRNGNQAFQPEEPLLHGYTDHSAGHQ